MRSALPVNEEHLILVFFWISPCARTSLRPTHCDTVRRTPRHATPGDTDARRRTVGQKSHTPRRLKIKLNRLCARGVPGADLPASMGSISVRTSCREVRAARPLSVFGAANRLQTARAPRAGDPRAVGLQSRVDRGVRTRGLRLPHHSIVLYRVRVCLR